MISINISPLTGFKYLDSHSKIARARFQRCSITRSSAIFIANRILKTTNPVGVACGLTKFRIITLAFS